MTNMANRGKTMREIKKIMWHDIRPHDILGGKMRINKVNKCLACLHMWQPRKVTHAAQCPVCRSRQWAGKLGQFERNRPTKWGWETFTVGESREYKFFFLDKPTGPTIFDTVDTKAMARRDRSLNAYMKKSGRLFQWTSFFNKLTIWRVT